VGLSEAAAVAGGVHGFPAGLTSFIGRADPVREVAVLLAEHRLVLVTGPGGQRPSCPLVRTNPGKAKLIS
jgi:hypothetical protein